MNDLDRTIQIWRSEPFIWGVSDCILSVCSHIERSIGINPAAPWRDQYPYSSFEEANSVIEQFGSVSNLLDFGMGESGIKETPHPKDGDPILVKFGREFITGIYKDELCVCRMANSGIIEFKGTIEKAWAI